MLLGVLSPLVYTYLAGHVKTEDLALLGGMQMRVYADNDLCALTVLAFLKTS